MVVKVLRFGLRRWYSGAELCPMWSRSVVDRLLYDLALSGLLRASHDGCLTAVCERPSEQERDRPGQTQLASREHLC